MKNLIAKHWKVVPVDGGVQHEIHTEDDEFVLLIDSDSPELAEYIVEMHEFFGFTWSSLI